MRSDRMMGASTLNHECKSLDQRLSALNEQVIHARRVLSRQSLTRRIEESGEHLEAAVTTVIHDVDTMVHDITRRLASLTGAMHDISSD